MRNAYVLGFGAPYIRDFTVYDFLIDFCDRYLQHFHRKHKDIFLKDMRES